jgi:hypothetical protein
MRISTLLAFVALFSGGIAATAPAIAADASCRFPPIADSAARLQHAQTVAVLYSENTLNTQQYLESYHDVAVKGAQNPGLDSRISQAFVDSSDPQRAIGWLLL